MSRFNYAIKTHLNVVFSNNLVYLPVLWFSEILNGLLLEVSHFLISLDCYHVIDFYSRNI